MDAASDGARGVLVSSDNVESEGGAADDAAVVGGRPGAEELARRVRMAQLDRFNALPLEEAGEALSACCASRRWVAALALSRPYRGVGELYRTAAETLASLDWPDVLEALAAHPRIGERAAGRGPEAAWSRAEQAAAGDADARTAAELAEANAEYEWKFGHVFLIRATGRTAAQMLTAARERLRHDELAERTVVRGELGQIVRLRLDKMLDGFGTVVPDPMSVSGASADAEHGTGGAAR
ncbi:MAG TPA: 2-oxo-4-hydroxy-4-carboxy-5-ureidoimidazoline decarboxylase [Thermoleophilia bacterium]|nr:2-oxo-4-hydroxy-4-carboxy-5-ureidoimidazoline decarboxylase [Thermoleophilia bacterium]